MTAPSANIRAYRYPAIDLLRGLVIILMAIDHVRDYFHLASSSGDPMTAGEIDFELYITRWITHFCAPVFVFLAGTSAGLMATRKSSNELAQFLIKRGLWLILIEIVIVSNGWTFSPLGIEQFGGKLLIIMQVIWVIGASMVMLGVLQYLPANMVFAVGFIIVFGHNSLDYIWPASENSGFSAAPLWVALHAQSSVINESIHILFYYPLLPWIGVIACGYGCARLFTLEEQKRKRSFLLIGISLITLFFILRLINAYGEPVPWQVVPNNILQSILSFFKVSKYPPSLMFLSITLGPAFIFLAYAQSWQGKLTNILITFGRVPFLFYIAHIYWIHLLAATVGTLQGLPANTMFGFFFFYPKEWGFSLIAVYVVWLFVLFSLYPLCAWFSRIKQQRKDWWLSYL